MRRLVLWQKIPISSRQRQAGLEDTIGQVVVARHDPRAVKLDAVLLDQTFDRRRDQPELELFLFHHRARLGPM